MLIKQLAQIKSRLISCIILFRNQQNIIKANKHIILKLSINFQLSKGSLILSIFYLFYNVDLLNNSTKKRAEAQKFINNITFIIIDKSTRGKNHKLGKNQKLGKVYNKICKNRKAKYKLEFSISKYQLINIGR